MLNLLFAALFFIHLFNFSNGLYKKLIGQRNQNFTQQLGVQEENPIRLKIPNINVDATIEYVGLTSKGAMEVPSNAVNVGWFDLGPRPGELGSAVIAGHFDDKSGKAGVFVDLYKLKKGDKLYVENAKGQSITFEVQGSRIYDPGYADEVFTRNDKAHLNLITCDGVWDGIKKSYSKRLVVFADLIN